MQILNASGEPYFGAGGLDISANRDGDWIQLLRFEIVSLSCEIDIGATAISGDLYAEATTDPAHARGISRVLLPAGSLHTSAAGVTLPTARTSVNLAAVADGACFTVTFSAPIVGWFRWRWTKSAGGSAPNRLFGYMEGLST